MSEDWQQQQHQQQQQQQNTRWSEADPLGVSCPDISGAGAALAAWFNTPGNTKGAEEGSGQPGLREGNNDVDADNDNHEFDADTYGRNKKRSSSKGELPALAELSTGGRKKSKKEEQPSAHGHVQGALRRGSVPDISGSGAILAAWMRSDSGGARTTSTEEPSYGQKK